MKHLRRFETEAAYNAAAPEIAKPYVALTDDNKAVHYSGNVVTYEMVDLGLPSGLKWASANIGAKSVTDKGLFFQFGATEGFKNESDFSQDSAPVNEIMNASSSSGLGLILEVMQTMLDTEEQDNPRLKPEYDAATQIMGEGWSIPSGNDAYELKSNCTISAVTNYNGSGVNGILYVSNINGNELFFPYTGNVNVTTNDSTLVNADSEGYVWTSGFAWGQGITSGLIGGLNESASEVQNAFNVRGVHA